MGMIKYAISGSFSNFSKKLDRVKKETGKSKVSLMFRFFKL